MLISNRGDLETGVIEITVPLSKALNLQELGPWNEHTTSHLGWKHLLNVNYKANPIKADPWTMIWTCYLNSVMLKRVKRASSTGADS